MKRPAAIAPDAVAKRFLPIPNPPAMHPKRFGKCIHSDDDQDGTRGDICTKLSYFEAGHGQGDGIDRGKRTSSRISSVNRRKLRHNRHECEKRAKC